MKGEELLYRLREIMPEVGVNPVADEMYNIVHKALQDSTILECYVCCENCLYSRELDRSDTYEGDFIEDCVWCNMFGDGMLRRDYCSDYHPNLKMAKEE